MKLYTKTIDGHIHTMPANRIVVIKDGMQIFNPTEEILFNDGWELYTPPVNELTEEEILKQEKENRINDLLMYDSSDNINIFYVNETPIWLDKATRSGLMLRFQAESAVGKTDTSLWYNSVEFKLPISVAIQILYTLEIYASQCYDVTQYHISQILKMDSLDNLKQYNYNTGYPEILRFQF